MWKTFAAALPNPTCARLTFDSATYGAAVTCGNKALSACQRCPRAARVSVLDSSSPKLCFRPRLMASCNDRGMRPDTSLAGTLPEKGFAAIAGTPGPDALETEVEEVCA